MAEFKSFTRPSFLIKVLELIIGLICVCLIAGNHVGRTLAKTEVVHATYFGFFIVTCIVVASYVLDAPIHGKLMMLIACAGAVLYFAAGAINLEMYDKGYKDDKILAAGILGIVNGVVHVGDVFLSWRG